MHIFPFPVLFDFVKKNRQNDAIVFVQITMDGDTKKPLKIVISDFYKLHMNKGKEYFKKFGIHKATIYRWMKKIEENGLKGRVHMANQNQLQSLVKF